LLFAATAWGQSPPAQSPKTYAKNKQWKNVKDFGAKGDGTTIDRAAFESAIAALPDTGGTVFVPFTSSAYLLDSTIVLPSNVTIRGVGKGSRIKMHGDSSRCIFANSDSAGGNIGIVIENLYLDGGKDYSSYTEPDSADAISLKDVSKSAVRNCWITNTDKDAIVFRTGATDCEASGNILWNLGEDGITASGADTKRIRIVNNSITGRDTTYKDGSDLIPSGILCKASECQIIGNTIIAGGSAFDVNRENADDTLRQITIANNTIIGAGRTTVSIADGYDIKIIGNTFKDCMQRGIFTWATDPTSHNIQIVGNSFWNQEKQSIYAASGDHYLIADNQIYGGDSTAIYVAGDFATVTGNKVNGTLAGHGIHLASSRHTTVEANIINGTAGHGIYCEGASGGEYVTIGGNAIDHCIGNGIYLLSHDFCTVIGNTCTDNDSLTSGSYSGIYLNGSYNNVISNNVCTSPNDMQTYGIKLSASTKNIISGNQLGGNVTDDINGSTGDILFGNKPDTSTTARFYTNNRIGIGEEDPAGHIEIDQIAPTIILDAADGNAAVQFQLNGVGQWETKMDVTDTSYYIRRSGVGDYFKINKDGSVEFLNYAFPIADGSAGQGLVTDGSGSVTFGTVGGSGETNTLADTGTFDNTSGFGLAGGKTGSALKVKGLVEGSNITITQSGDSGLVITSSGGSGGDSSQVFKTYDTDRRVYWPNDSTMEFTDDGALGTVFQLKFASGDYLTIRPTSIITENGDSLVRFNGTGLIEADGVLNVLIDSTTLKISNDTLQADTTVVATKGYVDDIDLGDLHNVTETGEAQNKPLVGVIGGAWAPDNVDWDYVTVSNEIDSTDLGENCVLGAELGPQVVTSAHIYPGTITTNNLANGAKIDSSTWTLGLRPVNAGNPPQTIGQAIFDYSGSSESVLKIAWGTGEGQYIQLQDGGLLRGQMDDSARAVVGDSLPYYTLLVDLGGIIDTSDAAYADSAGILDTTGTGFTTYVANHAGGAGWNLADSMSQVEELVEDSLNEYSLTTAIIALIADSLDEYSLTTAIRALIGDSLDEYSLTTAIAAAYETIAEVAKIGDDTANFKAAWDSAQALDETYETITNVGLIGDDTANFLAAWDSAQALDETYETITEVAKIGDDTTDFLRAVDSVDAQDETYETIANVALIGDDTTDFLRAVDSADAADETYETIANVGLIGDDTAHFKTAYDSSQHDYLRSDETAADVDSSGTEIAAALNAHDDLYDNFSELGGTVGDAQIANGAVDGGTGGEIADQTITKADIDTTASNFVFDDAYRGTSDEADSVLATKGYVDANGGSPLFDTNYTAMTVGSIKIGSDSSADWATQAELDSNVVSEPFYQGDATVTGQFVRWNYGSDLPIDKAHAAPGPRLLIPNDSTDSDANGIPDSWETGGPGGGDSVFRYSVLHPSVKYIPEGKWGYRYHAIFSAGLPYAAPGQSEAPIYRVSNDGTTWVRKTGIPDPICTKQILIDSSGYDIGSGYFSDNTLCWDASGNLWCIFRTSSGSNNRLWSMKYDGTRWYKPTQIMNGDEMWGIGLNANLLSPTITLDVEDTVETYKMWWVELKRGSTNDENTVFMASSTRPDSGWPTQMMDAEATSWYPPDTSANDIWHIEVIPYGPECLFGLYVHTANNTVDGGTQGKIYAAKSIDGEGLEWTSATSRLVAMGSYDNRFQYRASGFFRREGDEDVFDMIYSGNTQTTTSWATNRTTVYFSDTSMVIVDSLGVGYSQLASPFVLKAGSGVTMTPTHHGSARDTLTIAASNDFGTEILHPRRCPRHSPRDRFGAGALVSCAR